MSSISAMSSALPGRIRQNAAPFLSLCPDPRYPGYVVREDKPEPETESVGRGDDSASRQANAGRARLMRILRPFVMPGVYTLLTMAVFWRLWTPVPGAERSWRYDARHAYWGDVVFLQKTLSEAQIPMWNPHDRGGFPIYGDPQPGLLYPPSWALTLVASIGDQVSIGMVSLKIILHWIFGAIGMHLLIRRFGAKEPACYTAGVLFTFTSPKFRYMGSGLNWSVAWIPWVLLAVHWFSEKPSIKRGIVMGSSLAMVLLSGAPAVVLYTLILALPFGLYQMRGRILENWKPIFVAAGVTLLWVLPLVASNLEQLPESVRQVRSYSFINGSAFTPAHLVSYVVPRLEQGENPYIGAMAIFCIGLAIASRKNRGLAWIFLGITAFTIAISFGGHAGFLPALSSAFAPFSLFRHAHRYLYVASVAIAVLGGLGFGYLLSVEKEERKAELLRYLTWGGGALTFALGVAYLVSIVIHDKIDIPKNNGLGLAFCSFVVFTLLLRQLLRAGPRARIALSWALPFLVFLDVWVANFVMYDKRTEPVPRMENDDQVALLEGVDRNWRVYDEEFLKYRPGARVGIRDFSGYEGDPLSLSRYDILLKACKSKLSLMGHANVRYFLDTPNRLVPKKSDGKQIHPGIWELGKVAPAVYFVPAPLLADNAKSALAKLRRFDPGTNAVVEGDIVSGDAALPVVAGTITHLEPNHVVAEIETPGPGLVVIAEAYYPKWEATVNGKSTRILPANVMFRGIPVSGAGHQVIEMRLRPGRFWYLLPGYFLAFGLLLWSVWSLRRRRE